MLAAINEVETDYGRDLNVSSAGAEGWMQFLPSSWAQYGVDATGAGYEDPYNPADAIFAAARYLAAAGGARHIRAAVYSYNHSAAYVEAVMLRAQLLGGTPPELLSAITGLTESRFPVHAEAHFSDGFPVVPGSRPPEPGKTLAGTVIYSQAGAPVIAVQDGEVTAVGDSATLGRYVSLRDAYGNTYTYAQLGSIAPLYPVLEPRVDTAVSPRITHPDAAANGAGPQPSAPASAGVQPHSPLSRAAVTTGLVMGAANALETPPAPKPASPPPVLPTPAGAGGAASVRTPSAPVPTRSTSTRCTPVCRCWRAPCSGTSARPAKGKMRRRPPRRCHPRPRLHPPSRGRSRRRRRRGTCSSRSAPRARGHL